MTAVAFIQAIENMSGLPTPVVEHLTKLAEAMTDAQREEAVQRLTPMNEGIVKTQETIIAGVDQSIADIQRFEKEELPTLRASAESAERQQAEGMFGDHV